MCVNCGTVNQAVANIADSKDSYYFNELSQVSGGGIEGEKRKSLKNARELVVLICENIKGLVFKEELIRDTLLLIERCYEIRSEVDRTDPNYLTFPKDLTLLYCACMVYVINNSRKFVGKFSIVDDILAQCDFKCASPRDKLRGVVSVLERNVLLNLRVPTGVGESERLSEGLHVFLNEMSVPTTLANYMMLIHEEAVRNVWFNGKKPGIVAATVIYHVFVGVCEKCEKQIEKMVIKQHRGALVKAQTVKEFVEHYRNPLKIGLLLANIRSRFEVNLVIVKKCDGLIVEKHEKELIKKQFVSSDNAVI